MNKYPILILHGWNLEGNHFNHLKNEFIKRGFKVMCPDLPGFGSSTLNKTFTLEDYVKFVTGYLKENKLNKTLMIGHSFGGRIGIKLAAIHPELLSGLILTGVPGFTPVPKVKVLFFLVLAKIGRVIFSFPILRYFRKGFQKLLYKAAEATDFYNTKETMRETFQNVIKEKLDSYMANIKIPTYLIWGREDRIVPLSVAYKMLRVIKKSELKVINNGKHLVPATHVVEFADCAEKFMRDL